MRRCLLGAGLLVVLHAASGTARADAGPPLTIHESELRAALTCRAPARGPARTTVLLVHGTFTTGETSWGPTYVPTLTRRGHRTCTLTIPDRLLDDTRIDAEYVVFAVRTLRRDAPTRRVSVIAHSQGSMVQRWAMRWWPDVAASVDDVIDLAGLVRGSPVASTLCAGPCPAWTHFASEGSVFMNALNRPAMAPPVLDATSVFTDYDELIQPPSVAHYDGTPNTVTARLQELCPGRAVEHGLVLADAAVFAVVADALAHDGPADLRRIAEPCPPGNLEGVDSAAFLGALGLDAAVGSAEVVATRHPPLHADEPQALGYTAARAARFGELATRVRPTRLRVGARVLRIQVTVGGVPVRRAKVTAFGVTATSGADGAARLRVRPRSRGVRRVVAGLRGYRSGAATVRVR